MSFGTFGDDEVLIEIKRNWNKWLSGNKDISNFNFPRCVVRNNAYKSVEMHVFSDASRTAYAVMCFVRFIYDDGSVSMQFCLVNVICAL